MITNNGKEVITKFFGLQVPRIGASLALGTGTAAAAPGDFKLAFETLRIPVTAVAADLLNNRIVFKGSVPAGRIATIYELGLFHEGLQATRTQQFGLFQGGFATWDAGTFVVTNARRGVTSLKIDAGANATTQAAISDQGIDLSGYSANDSVVVGFTADANTASVRLRLGNDSGTYREFLYNAPVVGYNTMRANLGAGTDIGTVDLAKISYVAVGATAKAGGATSVYLDGIGIEDNRVADGMVARVVLGTPSSVDVNIPTEIEYSLGIIL